MRHVVVAFGLAAAIMLGTLTALGAQTSAKQFELVFNGTHEAVPGSDAYPFGWRHTGTFTATAPFCAYGTAVDLAVNLLDGSDDDMRRYTCDDGSGSITVAQEMFEEHKEPWTNTWRIVTGSDRYADLRGRGDYRGEFLSGDPEFTLTVVFRSTLRGLVDFDATAPKISVTGLTVTKLKRPARTYMLRFTLVLRDQPGATVSYTVKAIPTGEDIPVVGKAGSTNSGKAGLKVKVQVGRGVRTIALDIVAKHEIGNMSHLIRRLTRPR